MQISIYITGIERKAKALVCLAFKSTDTVEGQHLKKGLLIHFASFLHLFHRFIFEDYTPTNFDTFPAAIMTVFQVSGRLSAFCESAAVISVNRAMQEIQFWGSGNTGRHAGHCLRVMDVVVGLLSDPYGRGLEWGDVQWDSLARRSEVWHVVLNILHRAHAVWKLYSSCFTPYCRHPLHVK